MTVSKLFSFSSNLQIYKYGYIDSDKNIIFTPSSICLDVYNEHNAMGEIITITASPESKLECGLNLLLQEQGEKHM